MRPDALVVLHILAAATLLGGLLAVAVLSAWPGEPTGRLASRSAVLVAVAALTTVVIGEAAKAREDAAGFWLDVGSMLGYVGLLLPSLGLVVVTRRARGSSNLRPWVAWIALAMVIVALIAAFVMAAKPA